MIKINLRDAFRYANLTFETVQAIEKIKRLAKKHNYLAVCSCNGYGTVNGHIYYNGIIDDYARRAHGPNVKSSYITEDEEVFDLESNKITDKIRDLAKKNMLRVEFQGDPRGATVKLFTVIENQNITELLY